MHVAFDRVPRQAELPYRLFALSTGQLITVGQTSLQNGWTIRLGDLPPGGYLLELSGNEEVWTSRVIW